MLVRYSYILVHLKVQQNYQISQNYQAYQNWIIYRQQKKSSVLTSWVIFFRSVKYVILFCRNSHNFILKLAKNMSYLWLLMSTIIFLIRKKQNLTTLRKSFISKEANLCSLLSFCLLSSSLARFCLAFSSAQVFPPLFKTLQLYFLMVSERQVT